MLEQPAAAVKRCFSICRLSILYCDVLFAMLGYHSGASRFSTLLEQRNSVGGQARRSQRRLNRSTHAEIFDAGPERSHRRRRRRGSLASMVRRSSLAELQSDRCGQDCPPLQSHARQPAGHGGMALHRGLPDRHQRSAHPISATCEGLAAISSCARPIAFRSPHGRFKSAATTNAGGVRMHLARESSSRSVSSRRKGASSR